MKLRNKKTGEIIAFDAILPVKDVAGDSVAHLEYNSLAELNEEWEDAPEEPKEYWYMDYGGRIKAMNDANDEEDVARKAIGNYFETKEEAELAVEKLKAWKRLKDKGVKIIGYYCDGETNRKGEFSGEVNVTIDVPQEVDINIFYLLFGGEE
jgi:hypothetical protein